MGRQVVKTVTANCVSADWDKLDMNSRFSTSELVRINAIYPLGCHSVILEFLQLLDWSRNSSTSNY